MINYVTGDATLPPGTGRKVIAHVCNDAGAWGAGFVMALSARDRAPESAYRLWEREACHPWEQTPPFVPPFQLGEIQIVSFDIAHQPMTYVCNMIAQILVSPGEREFGIPLRLWALRNCLAKLNQQAKFALASVHMPRIGCGLAGGTWDVVEPIIASTLVDVPVTVYDLPDVLSPRDSEYFSAKDSTYYLLASRTAQIAA